MCEPWTINVPFASVRFSFVDFRYLCCTVTNSQPPHQKRILARCLHCGAIASRSWYYEHEDTEGFQTGPHLVESFLARKQHYVDDIMTEIELRYDLRKLFRGGVANPSQRHESGEGDGLWRLVATK